MSTTTVILLAVIGFAISWGSVPLITRYLRACSKRQLHQTHSAPVSRFGGLAIAVSFLVTAAITFTCYPVGPASTHERMVIVGTSLAMFLLGFLDDAWPLGAKRKLLGQVLIASAVYLGGIHIAQLRNPLTGTDILFGQWSCLATVFWLVAFTNLVNLIDGVDGLAAGICLMVMALLLYVGVRSDVIFPTLCAAGVGGALLGFLYYNFPPAKIYLGDGGAYFLGFLIGTLSIVHSHKGTVAAALLAPVFVLALPIVDVALAIVRRGLKGLPVFRPDRRHLHHRLADAGLSRRHIVLGFYGCTLFFLLLALGVFISQGRWLPMFFGIACAALLLSARSFSFSREWFAVGKVLGSSLGLRKQTRYVLALSRWLELEAQRSSSPEELWTDFGFLARKLGFSAVTLSTPEGSQHWNGTVAAASGQRPASRRTRYELPQHSSLEFIAPAAILDQRGFELTSELAAEAWLKATQRWQQKTSPTGSIRR